MTNIRERRVGRGNARFRTALIVSLILHVSAIILLAFYQGGSKVERKFYAPLHMVELSQPLPSPPAPVKPKATAPKPVVKKQPPPKAAPKKASKPKKSAAPAKKVVKRADKTPVIPDKPEKIVEKRTESDVAERIRKMREALESEIDNEAEEETGDVSSAVDRLREKYGDIASTPQSPTRVDPRTKDIPRIGEGGGAPSFGAGKNVMQQMRAAAYYNRVWAQVLNNWLVPPSLNTRGLTAIISVVVNRDGEILESYVEESSGNEIFDDSALKALIRATPLPSIPSDMPEDIMELGFRFSKE
ncbi:MAG: hypothetical protein C0608_05860 [Deltaproteobacteria bacterium]|nr:MAG: hypothetical protein C0608_05860 [Deltaproteobacteria bacterium]